MVFEDLPFTKIMAIFGAVIGLLLPSGFEILSDPNIYNNITTQPETIMIIPIAIFIHVIFGIIGALLLGFVGLIIDALKQI
jgi:hypothetical protein